MKRIDKLAAKYGTAWGDKKTQTVDHYSFTPMQLDKFVKALLEEHK